MNLFHAHNHSLDTGSLLSNKNLSEDSRRIRKIVIIGCVVNIVLMIAKLLGGYFGHSDALTADGYHSLNDVAADLLMLIFVGISYRPADRHFYYGYGKFETFSSFLISLFLLGITYHICSEAIESINKYLDGDILAQPDIWTVIIVVISMMAKEFLFRFYRYGARKTNNSALISNAWHHRSDALASIATLIGVVVAHFFGIKYRILDPIASIVLAIFILIPALRLLVNAFADLMDRSPDKETINKASLIAQNTPGVKSVIMTAGRKTGHTIYLDITIGVSDDIKIFEAARIAETVKRNIINELGSNTIVVIITAPATSSDNPE